MARSVNDNNAIKEVQKFFEVLALKSARLNNLSKNITAPIVANNLEAEFNHFKSFMLAHGSLIEQNIKSLQAKGD